MSLYPLRFAPVLKQYAWGGRKLAQLLGRDTPPGNVAESWEVSAHPNGPTPVLDGPLVGRTLSELLGEFGEALVGARNRIAIARERFPLLIKLLDANEWLSVQVHPSDHRAEGHHDDPGKTEMWVVLQADPGAELILGLACETDRQSLRRAIVDNRLESLLHRLPARAGDVFFVPAGTIHALGPGLLLAEIQQSSDTTYRLYDWGRNPDGQQPRPLHIEPGLAVLDLQAIRLGPVETRATYLAGRTVETLVTCPYFETQRLSLAAGERQPGLCDGETFELWCPLTGSIEVVWGGGTAAAATLRWLLLPAALGRFEVGALEDSTLLRVFTPEPPAAAGSD